MRRREFTALISGAASGRSEPTIQRTALKANDVSNTDLEVLLELNRNYVRSALESDVRWYTENLSEDFYITAPDGALLNREAFLWSFRPREARSVHEYGSCFIA
jgi:hypothetical protein